MAGLLIIGAAVAYVGIFWFLAAKAQIIGVRILTILIALAIPIWDMPIGLLKVHQLCSSEGGVHTDKDLQPTDSILVDENAGIRPADVLKVGFKTVEYISREGVLRYSMTATGLSSSLHSVPVSTLKYQFGGQKLLPWNLTRTDFLISRLSDNRVVARQTSFGWRGTWWEVASRIQVTSVGACPGVWDKPLLSYVAPRA